MTDQIQVLDKGFVRLVDAMGSDASIVQAARVSYGQGTKTPEEDRKLLKYLLKNQHTSPFEMVRFKFHIKLPIIVVRQWSRHRTWAYLSLNEISGRYTQLKDEWHTPDKWRAQDTKNRQGSDGLIKEQALATELYTSLMEKTFEVYEALLGLGVAREQAREALSLSVYTELYVSVDLHNLMHFLNLRDDSHAQLEIQEYAKALKQLTRTVVPVTMELYDELFSKKPNETLSLSTSAPLSVCKCTQCVCGTTD
jgi:thymidylate synthase (FAD)